MEMTENEHFWDVHSVVYGSRKWQEIVQDDQEKTLKSKGLLN